MISARAKDPVRLLKDFGLFVNHCSHINIHVVINHNMYSWVPNKRVYSISIFALLLNKQIFHPTRLLGTIFWNSTNSKPTTRLLGPTRLIGT